MRFLPRGGGVLHGSNVGSDAASQCRGELMGTTWIWSSETGFWIFSSFGGVLPRTAFPAKAPNWHTGCSSSSKGAKDFRTRGPGRLNSEIKSYMRSFRWRIASCPPGWVPRIISHSPDETTSLGIEEEIEWLMMYVWYVFGNRVSLEGGTGCVDRDAWTLSCRWAYLKSLFLTESRNVGTFLALLEWATRLTTLQSGSGLYKLRRTGMATAMIA